MDDDYINMCYNFIEYYHFDICDHNEQKSGKEHISRNTSKLETLSMEEKKHELECQCK